MEHSHVKSTIAIDPVRAALTKAELMLVKGQREDAISLLKEALGSHPDSEELKEKLDKVRAMPTAGTTVTESSGGGMGRVLLVVGAIVVAMIVFYAFVI